MRFGGTQSRPQWLQVGLGLAIIAATYLFLILTGAQGQNVTATGSTNALVALAGYLIGAVLIIWGVARQFTTSTYALIPIGIALNIVIGELTGRITAVAPIPGLTIYLDSIGTVLVAVLAGPFAGAATGGLSNIIWGFFNPIPLPFSVVAIAIGLLAGLFANIGWFRRIYLVPIAGLIAGLIGAIMSAPLSAFIFGGVTGAGTDALVAAFRAYGDSVLAATTKQGLLSDPTDKLITFVIAYLIIVALPRRLRTRFSQSSAAADKLPQ